VAVDVALAFAKAREPTVTDDGVTRWLHFGPAYVQSEMSLEDPWSLSLKYTQRMMAFLLFVPRPRHIVIVGLGGGSLTKFCHRHLPKTKITTIEIDARVIALAPQFELPPPGPRMQIGHADACEWFAQACEPIDVVLLDGYDEGGIASGFGNESFYRDIRARLRPEGLMVANILVSPEPFRRYKRVISACFDGRTLIQRVVPDGNNLVFAFNALAETPDWLAITREAKKLQARYGLDFPAYARSMRRAHERGPGVHPDSEESISIL